MVEKSSFEQLKDKLMQDPEFRKEYERQKPGYDFLLNLIKSGKFKNKGNKKGKKKGVKW